MPAGKEFVDQLRRAWDNGDAVLPIDTRLPSPAVERVLEAMKPSVVIDSTGDEVARSDVEPIEPGDALVMSTSGTTGQPKGVVLTHDAIGASAELTSKRLNVTSTDHWLACLPVAHIGGLSVITRALLTGTKLTVLPQFVPDAVTNSGATLVSLVTAAMRRINTDSFRVILLGGGPAPSDKPANAVITYGMTETGSGIVYDRLPLDGVEIRINDNEEVEVKSPTLLRTYRNGVDPKKADGWFTTGDAGKIDQQGKLYVHGRIGDMINTGGEKVWPVAVETTLRSHPAISEALVFGETDPEWGEKVVAHVETTGEINPEEVRDFLKQILPSYSVPKEIVAVEQLDRTNLGKIKRHRQRM